MAPFLSIAKSTQHTSSLHRLPRPAERLHRQARHGACVAGPVAELPRPRGLRRGPRGRGRPGKEAPSPLGHRPGWGVVVPGRQQARNLLRRVRGPLLGGRAGGAWWEYRHRRVVAATWASRGGSFSRPVTRYGIVTEGATRGFFDGFYLLFGGRSHNETWAGCIVPRTTPTSSAFNLFRSVSSRSLAEKASSVFAASYLLQ